MRLSRDHEVFLGEYKNRLRQRRWVRLRSVGCNKSCMRGENGSGAQGIGLSFHSKFIIVGDHKVVRTTADENQKV